VTALLLAVLTTGCASSQDTGGFETVYDPLEPLNRSVFKVNQAFDFILVKPVSATYRQVVPDPLKDMVTNFLRHLKTPVILLNELLQGDLKGAEVAATRFFLNTIVGVGGLVDIAGYGNPELAYRSEDFGQTMAVWEMGAGPYLVVPLLGPSSVRDGVGFVGDIAAESVIFPNYDPLSVGRIVMTAVDARSRSLDALNEIERSSIDFYAAVRSLYWQNRRSEIFDGAPPTTDAFPDFEDFEDFEDFDDEGIQDNSGQTDTAPTDPDMLLSEAQPMGTSGVGNMLILDLEPWRESGP